MAEPFVTVEVRMTPEDYVELKKSATWSGMDVAQYLLAKAQGRIGHGC